MEVELFDYQKVQPTSFFIILYFIWVELYYYQEVQQKFLRLNFTIIKKFNYARIYLEFTELELVVNFIIVVKSLFIVIFQLEKGLSSMQH